MRNICTEKECRKVNICILGGGNIGTLLLADIGRNDKLRVRLLTSKPNVWNDIIEVYDSNNVFKYSGKIDMVSDNPDDVIRDADIIISTLPSHVFSIVLDKINSSIKPGTWIGMMPGSGGGEFYLKKLFGSKCVLFGFQRVHGISRVKEYGKSVYDLGRKSELYIATIPKELSVEVATTMEDIIGIKCYSHRNYLNVTLTPSNPILHTSRLYSLFREYSNNCYWDREIEFYSDWTDEASDILIECDKELQGMCKMIGNIDLSGVKSLTTYYESSTPKEMTEKIRSIKAFSGIKVPMIRREKGYVPDFNSRYFKEDFPYGLCIIKSFCDIIGLNTPMIDEILLWYEATNGLNYFVEGKFEGKDLTDLLLPQNFGLKCVEDIVEFYGEKAR